MLIPLLKGPANDQWVFVATSVPLHAHIRCGGTDQDYIVHCVYIVGVPHWFGCQQIHDSQVKISELIHIYGTVPFEAVDVAPLADYLANLQITANDPAKACRLCGGLGAEPTASKICENCRSGAERDCPAHVVSAAVVKSSKGICDALL